MRALLLLSVLVLSVGSLAACSSPRSPSAPRAIPAAVPSAPASPIAGHAAAVDAGVRAVLEAQVLAWNSGDIRGFMAGYVRSNDLTFLSGGSVRTGWEEAYYGYVRAYPDQATMGVLTFSDLDVRPLSPQSALVWGRWSLARHADAPGGLFTLLFEETEKGWRIVHDHTSSE